MLDILPSIAAFLFVVCPFAFWVCWRSWWSLEARASALGYEHAYGGGAYMADMPDFASQHAKSAYISGFHDGLYDLRLRQDSRLARKDRALLARKHGA